MRGNALPRLILPKRKIEKKKNEKHKKDRGKYFRMPYTPTEKVGKQNNRCRGISFEMSDA